MFGFLKRRPPPGAGDSAPVFSLPAQDGSEYALADLIGATNLVLYFYPKDGTRVCTAESIAFKERLAEFSGLSARVVGVSSDTVASHREFASRFELPFPLLSDARGQLQKRYGVPHMMGLVPGRTTFVIDKSGKIRERFSSLLDADSHVERSLACLKEIEKEEAKI